MTSHCAPFRLTQDVDRPSVRRVHTVQTAHLLAARGHSSPASSLQQASVLSRRPTRASRAARCPVSRARPQLSSACGRDRPGASLVTAPSPRASSVNQLYRVHVSVWGSGRSVASGTHWGLGTRPRRWGRGGCVAIADTEVAAGSVYTGEGDWPRALLSSSLR